MQQLAAAIRHDIDRLVDRYEASLHDRPGYDRLPEALRRDLERRVLNLIADSLDAGQHTALLEYVQQRAAQWETLGFPLAWFQQALIIPEEILTPLISSVEAGNFLWQALNRSQGVVWQMAADRAHQTEERFRSIIETSHSGILITDDTFHLTYVNDELLTISGYTREELLGDDFRHLLDEESRRIVADHYVRRQRGEDIPPRYEVAFVHKSGAKRYIEMSAVVLKDLNGKPYTVAQVLDVSDRKQTEQALRASQQLLQSVMDNIPQAVFWKDQDLRYLGCNQAFAEDAGLAMPQHIIGKTDHDMPWATQAEAYRVDDRLVMELGAAKINYEEPQTTPTGETTWLRTSKVPMRDAAGNVTAVLGMYEDITARREAEETLARERNLLRTLIDTLPDQVFVKDTQGRLMLYNQADATAMRLNSTEEALGKTVYDFYPRELADAYFADDMAVIESDRPLIGREERGLTEDGQERWVLTTKVPLKDQAGRQLGLVGIARDITQRKHIAATLQESEERFRRFSEATTEGLVFHDKGLILDANPAIVALFGFATAAELVGRNLLEFIVPDSRPLVLQKMQLDDVHPYEVQCIRSDGSTFPAETSTRVYQHGERTIRASAVRDITERKRLELHIQESLARRSIQVQTSVEVAQHIAAAPEIGELFHRVVTLVKERFNYYHAQLFRYVPAEDAVELITGYGEVGQKMLATGHKVTMGRGVVGTAAATGRSVLAVDVTRDLDWRPNPHLPDTKGELAVPIKLGSGDAESQVQALRHFVTSHYDGIAVSAIDPEAVAPITREWLQHGNPVVGITNNLGPGNQTTLISAVEHELGYLLGVQAGTWAKQHLPADRPIKIGVLTYRTLPSVVQREQGIIAGIQSIIGERLTIVVSASALEPKEAAFLAEGWLRAYPDLNMIVAYNDATALGAYQAAQNLGWRDPDQFFIGGVDAVPEALAAIQEGGVYQATVNQPPEVMGIMAVRALVAAIKGLPVKPTYGLYCAPVNRSNAAEFSGLSREAAMLANQDIIPAEALATLDVSGLRLGLSVLTLTNPFFAQLAASAQQEAQRLGVQLVVNDPSRILGVLDVQSDQADTLTDDDRLLLEGLCGQIASAMESTRLLEQLRQNERQLNEALKIAQLANWEYDVATDTFTFSDQFYALLRTTAAREGGYTMSSAQYAQRFVHPDDAPLVGREVQLSIETTDPNFSREIDHRIFYADGELGYFTVRFRIEKDAQGRTVKTYGANQDITERQRIEEVLRQNEAQLSEALKIAKLGYWEYDVEKDLFHFNDQFYSIFHTTAEQAGGYQISSAQYAQQFVHPDDLPIVGAEIEQALNSTDRHYTRQLEHRVRFADGGVGHISVNINIDRDEHGKILRYYGANQDITERQLAEEETRRAQRFLDSIIENIPIMLFVKDARDLRFVRWNKAGEEVAGFPRADMIGKNDLDFFPAEEAEQFMAADRQVLASKQPIDVPEEQLQTRYQGIRTLHTRKIPILDEQGNPQYLLGISEDITERQQTEQRLQELLEKVQQSEQLMRTLIDAMPDHIYAKDVDGRLILANLAEARLHRVDTPEVLIGKSDFDFYPPELAERYRASELPILRDGIPLLDHEEPNQDATGRSFWSLTTKVPLRNQLGQIVGLVGKTTDITTRKLAEAERERLLREQQRRAIQLQTAAEVSRAASSIFNTDELLSQVADLVRDRFNFYYVGVFLIDAHEHWAVLQAGTGEAGRQLLASGHKLKIGGNSMISQCIVARQARIALDVGEEAVRFDNPLLPLTRSEMALPLISRGRVIGAATIQSDQPAAFTTDDVAVLQSMADQIGNAVENARLFEQAQTALQEVDAINRQLTGEAWHTYLRQQVGHEVIWLADDEAAPDALPELDEALTAGEITVEPDPEDETEATVTAPILLRGQPIGALRLRTPLNEWDADNEVMLADIASHIAQAVENARLVEQTQRTAQRERMINEINARVRQSVDLDAILRTAVNELGQSLKAAHVMARVGTTATDSAPAAGDGRGKTND